MSTGVEQDAILLDAEKDLSNQFNAVLGATIAVCVVFLFVSIYFENFLTPIVEEEENSTTEYTPLWDRYKKNYQTDLENGTILEKGPYSLLETANEWNSTHVFVEYELPETEGGAGVTNDAKISLAYWLPKVPEGVKVPVIAEFGPYFQEPSVQTPTIEVPGSWLDSIQTIQASLASNRNESFQGRPPLPFHPCHCVRTVVVADQGNHDPIDQTTPWLQFLRQ